MDLIDLEIKRTEHRAAEEGICPAVVAQRALDAASGKVQLQERCVVHGAAHCSQHWSMVSPSAASSGPDAAHCSQHWSMVPPSAASSGPWCCLLLVLLHPGALTVLL